MISHLLKWLNGPLEDKGATSARRARQQGAGSALDAMLLEDRILYSVTPVPDATVDAAAANLAGGWVPTAADLVCNGLLLPLVDPAPDLLLPQVSPVVVDLDGGDEAGLPSILPPLGVAPDPNAADPLHAAASEPTFCPLPQEPRHELVLVDQSLQNVEQLVNSLLSEGGPTREIEVVYLDASRDGFAQVDQALAGDTHFDAIHFLTHGDAGMIRLGNSWLDARTIEQRVEQIEHWSDSLTADADLLFYGCETAATESGQQWLGRLHELTDADVAASDDNSGNASSGGDWALEYQLGSLETASLFHDSSETPWHGLLATFAVTNTNDSGAGSLRQAILDANANVGYDTISFNIDTSDPNYDALHGVWRIQPLSDLPAITETALLDGWSQTGFSSNPVIELDGSLAAGSTAGLLLRGSDITIRGFMVHSFVDDGIELGGDNGFGDNNILHGNWVGLNAAGVAAPNGDHGILLTAGAANNIIGGTGAHEGNVIAGNTHVGIVIRNPGSDGNLVIGNYIGVGPDGVTAIGNGTHGIEFLDTANNNHVGGASAGEGNIIANSGGNGINVQGTSGATNTFLGNSIYSNAGLGIDLNADGVTANDAGDADAGPNDLQNFPDITDATSGGGLTVITGSLDSSVATTYRIEFFASPTADASGHGEGATYLGATTVTTDGSGSATFNVTLSGVTVTAGYAVSATATVDLGGGAYGATSEFGAMSAAVLGNSAPALDTSRSPTMNSVLEDAGVPSGAVGTLVSSLVDFAVPVGQVDNVTDADAGAQLGVAVTAADANGTWYYSVDNGANWSLLGAVSTANARLLAADSSTRLYFRPNADFNGNLASALTIRAWDQTSGTNGGLADTSTSGGMTAFSANTDSVRLTVTPVNDIPVLSVGSGTYSYPEGIGPVVLATTATVSDIDSADFAGGVLRVEFTANGQAEDLLGIRNQGTAAGQIGVSGSNVTYGGVTIGTFTGGTSGSDPLIVSFNSNATVAAVQQLTRNVTYENTSDNPSSAVRVLEATLSDGDGGTSAPVGGNLTITPTNDAPVNSVPGAQNMNEDSALVFSATNGNLISISDPDANSGSLTVTLSVTSGTLSLSGTGGLSFITGDGTADASLQFSGTAANINAALTGMTFTAAPGFTGAVTLGITTSDNGNTGLGGALSDADNVTINIAAVNDAPVAADERLAMNFDGVDDYVSAGTSASLQMTNTMTMEAWINPDVSANVNQMIINREGEYELGIFPDGHLQWAFANTSPGWNWHDTGYVVAPGQWTHVAVTYDNGTVTTYVNGVSVDVFAGSGAIGDSHPTLNELRIGGRSNAPASKFFDGRIDDVRIWNVARSQAEIAGAMNVELSGGETGLAGYWNFNENSGATATDATANGNTGTLVNGAAWYGYRTGEDVAIIANVPGVLANDYDADGDPLTAELVTGPANGTLLLNSDGSFTYTPNMNFNGTDSFTYRAFDGNSYSDVATVTILVDPSNDGPTITSDGGGAAASLSVAENSTAVTIVTASDPDGPAATFSIAGGADAALFTIDATTGALSFVTAPDRESPTDANGDNIYSVIVQVSDGSLTDSQTLDITVTDVDEFGVGAITDANGAANAVNENAANGTAVGITAFANDADATGNVITYTLDDDAGGRFAINATTGVVTVADGTQLDREAAASHGIIVRATSLDGTFSTQAFTINLNAVNDVDPTITSSGGGATAVVSVAENSTAVTTVTATDADLPAQTLTYSISGGADAGLFTIDATTGALTFVAAPNFEAPADAGGDNVYDVIVQVSDGAGRTDTQSLQVTVTDVNEDPVAAGESYSVNNRQTLTVSGPGVLANDSDPEGTALAAVLVSGPQHGTLTLNADGSLTYTPNANFVGTDSFTYQASDGTNASAPVTVQLTVTSTGGPLPPGNSDSDGDSSGGGGGGDSTADGDGDGPTSQHDGGNDPGIRDNPLRPPTSPVTRERHGDDNSPDGLKPNDAPPRSNHSGGDPAINAERAFEVVAKGARRVATSAERIAAQAFEVVDADSQVLGLALAELRKDVESSVQFGRYLAGTVTIASAATSAGYALWALRSAHFVTTFLATIPAWRRFDPLPLVSGGTRSKWEEGESLAEIAMRPALAESARGGEEFPS